MILPSPYQHAVDQREVAKAFGATLRADRTTAGITQELLAEGACCDCIVPTLPCWNVHSGNPPSERSSTSPAPSDSNPLLLSI
jgi:hypothetical protein